MATLREQPRERMRARHRDEALATILDDLAASLAGTCLAGRERGGIAQGVGWLELAGRAADGRWLELKLHHHQAVRRLDAGLIAYLPMRDGGGSRLLHECSWPYLEAPSEAIGALVAGVSEWLAPAREEAS
jgi:hypothetical protein